MVSIRSSARFMSERKLVRPVSGEERGHGHEAAIARTEVGTFPDIPPKHFVIRGTQTPGDILVTIRESHPMQRLWCDILVMTSENERLVRYSPVG